MKNLLSFLTVLCIFSSCSPSSNGVIEWRDKPPCHSCAYLLNTSTTQKITFVCRSTYTKTNGEISTSQFEYHIGPQEEETLGCDRDYPDTTTKIDFQIISAYISK